MNVNGEGTNTQAMQNFAMTKQAVVKGGLKHETVNLLQSDILDLSQSCILNSKAGDLLNGKITSDADAQLIIKLCFKEKVSLTEVLITPGTLVCAGRPRAVKFFANRPTCDFSDITDIETGTDLILPDSADQQTVILAGKNFSRISSLQIFIEDNHLDSDTTFLQDLKVIGSAAPNYHVEYKSK